MNFIGIDPGLDGGFALIGQSGTDPCVVDIPVIVRQKGKGKKREYNIAELCNRLRLQTQNIPRTSLQAYLESVHAMPRQGTTSMFSMGQGLGIWQALLTALEIPYELITPQAWKKSMLDGTGKDKEASRLKALQMFPALAEDLKLKKDEGKAESLLIAEYGRRLYNGKISQSFFQGAFTLAGLTQKQSAILEFIKSYSAKNGFSPTIQDIADAFGIKSKNAIHKHLVALENKGYLLRGAKGTARTFQVAGLNDLQEKIKRLAVLATELIERVTPTDDETCYKYYDQICALLQDTNVQNWLNNAKKNYQQELPRVEQ